jgi:hypothetical protein
MKRLMKLTISVAVLAWFLIPTSGYAQRDTKVFHGASCQPFNDAHISGLQSHFIGTINASTGTRIITCPIVADSEALTPGRNLFVQAVVQSQNNQTLTCFVVTMSLFGSLVEFAAMPTTTQGFPTLITRNLTLSGDVGYYTLLCALPPGGRIFDYIVTE